jgi:hypothetical protein
MAERDGAYRVTSRYFLPASKLPIGLRLALSRANRTLNIKVQETSLAQHLKNKRRPQPSDKARPFFGRGVGDPIRGNAGLGTACDPCSRRLGHR